MQRIYKFCSGLVNEDKVEFGFIPDKVHCYNLDDLQEYEAFPSLSEEEGGRVTMIVAAYGAKSPIANMIVPFEGEFIPPENEGEANTRLSKGIQILVGIPDPTDLLIVAEMND